MTALSGDARERLAAALSDGHAAYYADPRMVDLKQCQIDALLPVVADLVAEELRAAADAYESDDEQPYINHLAEVVYRPGDCLSSIWLRARAAELTS